MTGHGGARNGAGAPARGVSQTKRMIVKALHRGLEIAGREKGLEGEAEAVATEAAAQIAADMVRSGRGDEVLKLLTIATPAREDGGDEGKKRSLLHDAIARLPGIDDETGTETSLGTQDSEETEAESGTYSARPTDQRSIGRADQAPAGVTVDEQGRPVGGLFWPGQQALDLGGGALAGARGAYGGRSAAPASPATPPRTRPGPAPTPMGVQAENFENFEDGQ